MSWQSQSVVLARQIVLVRDQLSDVRIFKRRELEDIRWQENKNDLNCSDNIRSGLSNTSEQNILEVVSSFWWRHVFCAVVTNFMKDFKGWELTALRELSLRRRAAAAGRRQLELMRDTEMDWEESGRVMNSHHSQGARSPVCRLTWETMCDPWIFSELTCDIETRVVEDWNTAKIFTSLVTGKMQRYCFPMNRAKSSRHS